MKNKKIDWDNSSKAEGMNLIPGSDEYREYVFDRLELDEFEQEQMKLGKINDVNQKEIGVKFDEPVVESEQNLDVGSYYSQRRIFKMAQQREVQKNILHEAMKTPEKEDDIEADRLVPKRLRRVVYNDTERDLDKEEKDLENYFDF